MKKYNDRKLLTFWNFLTTLSIYFIAYFRIYGFNDFVYSKNTMIGDY